MSRLSNAAQATHTAPIVGMHFRPPAKAILAGLASGTPLSIVPEPSNPFDANALAVFVATANIPKSSRDIIEPEAIASGFEWTDILAAPAWQLGYIAARDGSAAALQPKITSALQRRHDNNPEEATDGWEATLAFDAAGKPLATLTLPDVVL